MIQIIFFEKGSSSNGNIIQVNSTSMAQLFESIGRASGQDYRSGARLISFKGSQINSIDELRRLKLFVSTSTYSSRR